LPIPEEIKELIKQKDPYILSHTQIEQQKPLCVQREVKGSSSRGREGSSSSRERERERERQIITIWRSREREGEREQ
jgi:hypothetical protein